MFDVFLKSNTVVRQLNSWFIVNKLCLNVNKTCYSAFGNRSGGGCIKNVVELNDTLLSEVVSVVNILE